MNLTAKVYLLSFTAFPLTSCAQFAVFGELFISANNEFHIAFEDTYFAGGQIVTAKETRDAGVVSFGHRSRWRQLQKNSYIYGTVKIYHTGRFTFPLGSASIFSPLILQLSQNTGYIQVSYTEQTTGLKKISKTSVK